MIFNIPWWVFIIFLFICFSGYMSFRAMRAERQLEQQFIEREGQIFIERMNQEKERREGSSS
ncbi:sporulation YhaL family protein [Pseudogracilibacillus auburnensis]|uniref:sporulation YhaL family protein n=1 Tax=Pseudogracilibacillus auburnensis TaxID=1494959 RepID=UPI000D7637F0|nr:sporulation YhaL family protein [Pseudogracilibacillus auburnensis]MBO1002918.1 sporulation YhaL family protein [Pseudogracilibacillus auburnensis]